MKKLPLLSSDFKKFSWNTRIGDATVEQLQASYNALVNKELTTNYSRIVWNDMIDLLYKAMTQAGLSWDDKYASYPMSRIMFKYDELYAFKFNSVAYNISKLISQVWKWEIDSSVDGYVGRIRFYGVSEIGARADFVYGWYILELARVINLFISILKNEANFSEFEHIQSSKTTTDITLVKLPVIGLSTDEIIKSRNDASLTKTKVISSSINEISSTKVFADSIALRPKFMDSKEISKSIYKSKMNSPKAKSIGAKHISESLYISKLTSPKAIHTDSIESSFTRYEADMNAVLTFPIASDNNSYTNLESAMNLIRPVYLDSNEISTSKVDSILIKTRPKLLETNEISVSNTDVGLTRSYAKGLESTSNSQSKHYANLRKCKVVELSSYLISRTSTEAMLSNNGDDEWVIRNGSNLHIKRVFSRYVEGNELFIDTADWLEPLQEESNLYIRQVYKLKE